MQLTLDGDLLVFVVASVTDVFKGMQRLRARRRRIPARYLVEQVAQDSLSDQQKNYFRPLDEELGAMNYFPLCTFRVTNYGHNLMRRYVNPSDPAQCLVTLVELTVPLGTKKAVGQGQSISFTSEFAGGSKLWTRNTASAMIFKERPNVVQQDFPRVRDLATLKKLHDKRAAHMGCPVTLPLTFEGTAERFRREHEDFCRYQVQVGNLMLGPGGDEYLMTDKVLWRGVGNHFNPFSFRFPWSKFVPAAILAAGSPAFVAGFLLPRIGPQLDQAGVAAAPALALASYIFAGGVIGYLLERQVFLWSFLLTYAGVHLAAGSSLGFFPYSTVAALVAYFVSQAKKRRRLVLLPAGER